MSKTTAIATSPLTSAPRERRPPAVAPRLLSRSASRTSTRADTSAGITPKSAPVAIETNKEKTEDRNVDSDFACSRQLGGREREQADDAPTGEQHAKGPPASPTISDSTRHCRATADGDAPSARRTAMSFSGRSRGSASDSPGSRTRSKKQRADGGKDRQQRRAERTHDAVDHVSPVARRVFWRSRRETVAAAAAPSPRARRGPDVHSCGQRDDRRR